MIVGSSVYFPPLLIPTAESPRLVELRLLDAHGDDRRERLARWRSVTSKLCPSGCPMASCLFKTQAAHDVLGLHVNQRHRQHRARSVALLRLSRVWPRTTVVNGTSRSRCVDCHLDRIPARATVVAGGCATMGCALRSTTRSTRRPTCVGSSDLPKFAARRRGPDSKSPSESCGVRSYAGSVSRDLECSVGIPRIPMRVVC